MCYLPPPSKTAEIRSASAFFWLTDRFQRSNSSRNPHGASHTPRSSVRLHLVPNSGRISHGKLLKFFFADRARFIHNQSPSSTPLRSNRRQVETLADVAAAIRWGSIGNRKSCVPLTTARVTERRVLFRRTAFRVPAGPQNNSTSNGHTLFAIIKLVRLRATLVL